MRADKILKNLLVPMFNSKRTKEIFKYNPAMAQQRVDAANSRLYVYHYNDTEIEHCEVAKPEDLKPYTRSRKTTWINMDGLAKASVEAVSQSFKIHYLLTEDILSIGQRPKFDEIEGVLFCLLNMLYWNESKCAVEQEQITIVLGKNFVITFQEDAERDVFKIIRDRLLQNTSKLRQRGADYLCYSLLDIIVDHYFIVIEKLGEKIEGLEDEIIRTTTKRTLAKLNSFKKELIFLKRNVAPVRDMLNQLIKSENSLMDEQINKYLKDVYDHIIQANEVVENYRDIMSGMQDLYISQVNLKMNEAMKVMAIVTCLLAPATVIGGIFGMNFEIIPITHQKWGFYITVFLMFFIGLIMLRIFKKRGWF